MRRRSSQPARAFPAGVAGGAGGTDRTGTRPASSGALASGAAPLAVGGEEGGSGEFPGADAGAGFFLKKLNIGERGSGGVVRQRA
jgi:hypothetical protein